MTRRLTRISSTSGDEKEVDGFGERMNMAIMRAGGATIMSERAEVSTSVLRKWRAGHSEPTRTNLIRMALAAGVSVNWLVTGEGDATSPGVESSFDIDLDALEDVIVQTKRLFEQKNITLKPEAEARVIRLIYEFYIRQGQPMDEASLNNVIELATF